MAEKTSTDTEKQKPSSPVAEVETRQKWGNQMQFLLSCIGYTVGFGNVWRFSFLVYQNGGGAFLIPYLISVVLAGLPLYAMDLAIGQFSSLGPASAYRRIAPLFQGVGWGTVMLSFNITMYFNVIIAWILLFMFESFRSEILWAECHNWWNTYQCGSGVQDKVCKDQLNDTAAKFFNFTCYNSSYLNDSSLDGEVLSGAVAVNATIGNTIHYGGRLTPAEEYYQRYILGIDEQVSWYNLGKMNWRLFGCFAAAWVLVFLCLFGGVQTSGKVIYFTAIFPYVMIFTFLIYGCTLDGAMNGISYYVTPVPSRLQYPKVWLDAATQVFYTLGAGQGSLVTLASYNEFHNNFVRDAMIVVLSDSFTSSLVGLTTFAMIGYTAFIGEVDVSQAVKQGPGLLFMVFPQAIANLPVPQLWSVLFFLMMLTIGLDSQFAMFETVTTAVFDSFPKLRKKKPLVNGVGCLLFFVLGAPMCTQAGIIIFQLISEYGASFMLSLLALYQVVIVFWVYGLSKFQLNISRMLSKTMNYYWQVSWLCITPIFLLLIFCGSMAFFEASLNVYTLLIPIGAHRLGWVISLMPVIPVLFFAVYRLVDVWRKKEPWSSLILPTAHWCPAADLAKRSKARHEGSTRLHALDHPYEPKLKTGVSEAATSASSALKPGAGAKSAEV